MRNDDASPSSPFGDIPIDGSTLRIAPGSSMAVEFPVGQSGNRVHCLNVIHGAEAGRQIVLSQGEIVIGRCPPADVSVADAQISRRHCQLQLEGDRLWVTDLQSTNGSYVRQRKIAARSSLPIGATLRLGGHLFRHEFRPQEEVELEQSLWRAPNASEAVTAQSVDIDSEARHQQVQKIVSSEFFTQLTRELDALRGR